MPLRRVRRGQASRWDLDWVSRINADVDRNNKLCAEANRRVGATQETLTALARTLDELELTDGERDRAQDAFQEAVDAVWAMARAHVAHATGLREARDAYEDLLAERGFRLVPAEGTAP